MKKDKKKKKKKKKKKEKKTEIHSYSLFQIIRGHVIVAVYSLETKR